MGRHIRYNCPGTSIPISQCFEDIDSNQSQFRTITASEQKRITQRAVILVLVAIINMYWYQVLGPGHDLIYASYNLVYPWRATRGAYQAKILSPGRRIPSQVRKSLCA